MYTTKYDYANICHCLFIMPFYYLLTIRTPRLHREGIAQQLHEHLDLYDPSEMTII